MRFDFAVLGTLRASVDGRPLDIAAGRQKTLLATLLLRAGHPVSRADLIDRIWNDDVPANPTPALHSLVLRLRRTLADEGGHLIRAHGTGYLISVEPDGVDLNRFEALWAKAQAAAMSGEVDRRAALMRAAMATWRGEPLADVRSDVLHRVDVPPLVERRDQAAEEHFEAELDAGQHVAIVPLLREAIARSPLREGLWRQLMMALYRGGRQAEALDTYRELAKVLDAELGLAPGPAVRQLQRDILNGDPVLVRPARATAAGPATAQGPLFQLPADPGPLPGRDRAVDTLRRLLTGAHPSSPPLACVTGPPGAGKTALAVHVAHAVRDDFPDGQWYLSLGGHQPAKSTVDPQVELLMYAGIRRGAVPETPEARAAMLRAALANRRVLIVLDDAASAEQVGPLLPGTGSSAVVVTARSRLGGLVALHGARALEIGPLDPPDAVTLLAGVFREHGLMLRPDTVEELARHCGYLPLALRIAAANVASGDAADAVHYVQRLREGDRLGGLCVDGESGLAVRAAIEPSYRRLDETARRALRLQASSPSDDFTTADIAALLDTGWADAAAIVRTLSAANLIRPSRSGRWVTHDLIRLYAAEASRREDTDADRFAAISRLLRSYLATADTLVRQAYTWTAFRPPPAGRTPPPQPLEAESPARWFRAEHHNLVAAVRHAAAAGPPQLAWRLADRLHGYLHEAGFPEDWRTCALAGLAQAEREGDDEGVAAMQASLATLSASRADHIDARRRYTAALTRYRRLGDLAGQAATLNNLGILHRLAGQLDEAGVHHDRALEIYRELGDRHAELTTLSNAGMVLMELDRLSEAVAVQRMAVTALTAMNDPHHANDIVNALHNLAVTARIHSRPSLAVMYLTRTVALRRRTGSQYGQASDLAALALSYVDLGYPTKALTLADQSLDIARRIGRRHIEADALHARAAALHRLGNLPAAASNYREAIGLSRQLTYRHTEITAHIGLSVLYHGASRAARATRHARTAWRLAERGKHRLLARLTQQALPSRERVPWRGVLTAVEGHDFARRRVVRRRLAARRVSVRRSVGAASRSTQRWQRGSRRRGVRYR